MVDDTQLPAILKLTDDRSERVRRAVFQALAEFGDDLPGLLGALDPPPGPEQREQILADVERFRSAGQVPAVDGDAAPAEGPSLDGAQATSDDDDEAAFEVGQLVRHRRYGYLGLIVSADTRCEADESWYRANKTQPPREQPWYHVLVNGTAQVTYAAHGNLTADESDESIEHPLVEHFFDGRDGPRYTRNDQPWPGWGQNA